MASFLTSSCGLLPHTIKSSRESCLMKIICALVWQTSLLFLIEPFAFTSSTVNTIEVLRLSSPTLTFKKVPSSPIGFTLISNRSSDACDVIQTYNTKVCADLVHGAKDKQLRVKEPVRTHLICNPSRPLVTHLICNPSIMQSCALALWAYVALVWELDDIMLKMESSDNFCSSINGDHEDDVIEVYDDDDDDDVDHNRVGDSDDLDNVGLEHEEEVDSEVDNDDYRDYDDV
ncbi:hypothetical protein JHK85_010525 [Glycine max]|nr:hypothetical protein JHK85_010525 [Glycine max]KAG5066515.1 hypothetical protein JHK86_010246 [Glycine max]